MRTATTRPTLRLAVATLSLVLMAVLLAPAPPAVADVVSTETLLPPAGATGGLSLALDNDGHPVLAVSYFEAGLLAVIHCGDPTCSPDDSTVNVVDQAVVLSPSLALNALGNPVVAYYEVANADLRIAHCGDQVCSPENATISIVDAEGDVGFGATLRLDDSGNPVIAYARSDNGNQKVASCNDPACLGGDEVIAGPDREGDVGGRSDMVIGPEGNPIIVYPNNDTSTMKVMFCNDPACTGQDEIIHQLSSPDSFTPSIELVPGAIEPHVLITHNRVVDDRRLTGTVRTRLCTIEECLWGPPDGYIFPFAGNLRLPVLSKFAFVDGRIVEANLNLKTGLIEVTTTYDPPDEQRQNSGWFVRRIAPIELDDIEWFDFAVTNEGAAVIAYTSPSVGTSILTCEDTGCVPLCAGELINFDVRTGDRFGNSLDRKVARGTSGDDEIWGTPHDDIICGLGGDDTINAGRGDDQVFAGAGNDIIEASKGNDFVSAGPGNDTIIGGTDNDRLFGGPGDDQINGGLGNDRLSGGNGNDRLRGGPGNDKMFGNLGSDFLGGDGGNDILKGGSWLDELDGGWGDDDRCGTVEGETRVNCERGVFGI